MYFKLAIQSRTFAVGDYQIGRITGIPSINYAHPLLDSAGNVEAVIFIAQSLDWLTIALADLQFPAGAVLVVTDRNGTVLARVPDAEGAVGKRLPEPALLAALARSRERGLFEGEDADGDAGAGVAGVPRVRELVGVGVEHRQLAQRLEVRAARRRSLAVRDLVSRELAERLLPRVQVGPHLELGIG